MERSTPYMKSPPTRYMSINTYLGMSTLPSYDISQLPSHLQSTKCYCALYEKLATASKKSIRTQK